eukprot:gb/GEZN01005905.1/.p1 GENE.gb/GEZN01005905.1/~~gb/GEZN01005905.1/.p1  ORF type:complete len:500 (+),score=53.11 gb/GEZN01005905.1/:27-1502(+)
MEISSEQTQKPAPKNDVGAGGIGTILNLVKTIIGAGSVTIPYAMLKAGWLGGLIMLVFAACFSNFSFNVLIKSSDMTGLFSYKELADHAFGKRGGVVAQMAVMCYTFGTLTGYCVLVGDLFLKPFHVWLPEGSILLNRQVLVPLLGFMMLLLSLPSTLNALRYTSLAAILCVLYTDGLLCVRAITQSEKPVLEMLNIPSDPRGEIFLAFPLLIVAFTAHYNYLRFYQELEDRSEQKIRSIGNFSIVTCFCIYATMGLGGYALFGPDTHADVLNSLGDHYSAQFARLALAICIMTGFPLVHHALRRVLVVIIFGKDVEDLKVLWTMTLFITCFCVSLALVADNIGTVLGFNGSVFGVTLVYILPSVIFLRIDSMHNANGGEKLLTSLGESHRSGQDLSVPLLPASSNRDSPLSSNGAKPLFNGGVSSVSPSSSSVFSAVLSPHATRMLWRATAYFTIGCGFVMGIIGVLVNIKKVMAKHAAHSEVVVEGEHH